MPNSQSEHLQNRAGWAFMLQCGLTPHVLSTSGTAHTNLETHRTLYNALATTRSAPPYIEQVTLIAVESASDAERAVYESCGRIEVTQEHWWSLVDLQLEP